MKRPINVINIPVAINTSGNTEKATLDDGKIIGISIYDNGYNATDMVQAGLSCNGDIILPLHAIQNYRNRETQFSDGYIPLPELDGGKSYAVQIYTEGKFNTNANFQAVFVYKNEICN